MPAVIIRVSNQLPPYKVCDPSTSMWAEQGDRLRALRKAAVEAMGEHPPCAGDYHFHLLVYTGRADTRDAGERRNYVNGVLDGLGSADPDAGWSADPDWDSEDSPIHPSKVVAVEHDAYCHKLRVHNSVTDGESHYEIWLHIA
jgi:hypothetical protein